MIFFFFFNCHILLLEELSDVVECSVQPPVAFESLSKPIKLYDFSSTPDFSVKN